MDVEKPGSRPASKKKSDGNAGEALPGKDALLKFIRSSPTKVGKREIARAFNLKGADRIRLKEMLRELTEDGQVTKRRKRLRGRASCARSRSWRSPGRTRTASFTPFRSTGTKRRKARRRAC